MNRSLSILFASTLTIASTALADTTTHYWSYQSVTGGMIPVSGSGLAISMRSGGVYPEVFFQSDPSTITSMILQPGTNPTTGTSWFTDKTFTYGTSYFPVNIRAESSSSGRVAFVATSLTTPLTGAQSGNISGWTNLPTGTVAAAYDSAGNLHTATQTSIYGMSSQPNFTSPIAAMDISKNGDIAIVTTGMKYYQYSAAIDQWVTGNIASSASAPTSMDVAFDSNNRPHVIVSNNTSSTVTAYDFDIPSATWQAQVLTTNLKDGYDTTVSLVSNDDGTVGTALATKDGVVYYFKDDVKAWNSELVLGSSNIRSAALEYDYNDLPVIVYWNGTDVALAYDPISAVPEPATMSVLLLGGSMLLIRRKR